MELTPADCSCVEGAREAASTSHSSSRVRGGTAAFEHDEVCPLCLARYASALERVCIVCEAPSCPDCAELLPGSDAVLCYACPVPTKH